MMTAQADLPAGVKLLGPGEGHGLRVFAEEVRILLAGEETGGQYAMIETAAPPGGGPPLHVHRREDEAFYVREGQFEVRVGEETLCATPGTFLFAPRGIPHTYRNVGPERGLLIVAISPPGFERFFEELDALCRDGPPPMDEVTWLAGRYELTFLT